MIDAPEPADRDASSSSPSTTGSRSARSTRPACCSPSGSGGPSPGASSSGPPRWPRRSAPRWSSSTRRSAGRRSTPRNFVNGIAALEESTGIAFAVENMYPWRASSQARRRDVPARLGPVGRALREHHHRPLARRHRRLGPDRDGRRGWARGCVTSTSPTAPARPRTSTWCPGAARSAPPSSCSTWPAPASRARSSWRSTPASAAPAPSARTDLRESLEFAREHFLAARTGWTR